MKEILKEIVTVDDIRSFKNGDRAFIKFSTLKNLEEEYEAQVDRREKLNAALYKISENFMTFMIMSIIMIGLICVAVGSNPQAFGMTWADSILTSLKVYMLFYAAGVIYFIIARIIIKKRFRRG